MQYTTFLNLLSQFIINNYNLQNEYLASCDLRREFISGFSGSAGIMTCKKWKQPKKRKQVRIRTRTTNKKKILM